MSLFGKNGFVRKQEIAWAKKLLIWQYEKSNQPLPDKSTLSSMAEKIVSEAHQIAKKRGSNVLSIIKEMIQDFIANRNKDKK